MKKILKKSSKIRFVSALFISLVFIGFSYYQFGLVRYGLQKVFIDKDDSYTIVLDYHSLVDGQPKSGSEMQVNDFAHQMKYLKKNGYQTLSLEEFYQCYKEKKFPKKSVLITFDDGYLSFYTKAVPILNKYHYKATCFPIVSFTPGLDRRLIWDKHMTFFHLRAMNKEKNSFDIGSHSFDLHYMLSEKKFAINKLPKESDSQYIKRIENDLSMSKQLLEMETDKEVTALAWPYGQSTDTAVNVAKAVGFKMIFTIEPGVVTANTSMDRIPRFLVKKGSLSEFKNLLTNLNFE